MPEILTPTHPVKARKKHICSNCCKEIQKGETYLLASYLSEGLIYNWKTCSRCRDYVDEAFFHSSYDFSDGMSGEDFHSYMEAEHPDVLLTWQQS